MSHVSPTRRSALTALLALGLAVATLTPIATAGAVEPSKWALASQWGSNVDETKVEAGAAQSERNLCTVLSKDTCQPGALGSEAGGFAYPKSVAVAPDGNVYVADENHRVQEFTGEGEFVLMFGWKVNKNGGNVCTKAEEAECQAGEAGTGLPEQISEGEDIAVDETGHVYVWDKHYWRVDEYTETGGFVWMAGGEVNETQDGTAGASEVQRNLCTEQEIKTSGVQCRAGVERLAGSTSRDAFDLAQLRGNLLAIDEETQLLYVGEADGRVQEIEASGKWAGEIAAGSPVTGVAVGTAGTLFVTGRGVAGVHEYKAGVLQSCVIDAASSNVQTIATDAYGRLGVIEFNFLVSPQETPHGALYETSAGKCGAKISASEFDPPSASLVSGAGLAFDVATPSEPLTDRMYVVLTPSGNPPFEIAAYAPVVFPEAKTCEAEEVAATSAKLCGEINPNGILTTGFFNYGVKQGELPSQTPPVVVGEGQGFAPFHAALTGLTPNEEYWYRTTVQAEVSGRPETAGGEEVMFHTSTPAPEVSGAPVDSFVKSSSAVLSGRVNPEHAATRFHFEYGPCATLEGCTATGATPDQESSLYGEVGVIQEAVGLAPGTTYSYRLVADNAFQYQGQPEGGVTKAQEGHFTTATIVPQVLTGSYSGVSATGALVTGSVNPGGEPALYRFELGVYDPAGTQYGVILSAPAGQASAFTPEQLQLAGLQPGTTYAYRIAVQSAYAPGEEHVLHGEPVLFTTAGLPAVLPVPAAPPLLAVPSIVFPARSSVAPRAAKCGRGRVRRHGRCVKPRRKQKKGRKGHRSRRAARH